MLKKGRVATFVLAALLVCSATGPAQSNKSSPLSEARDRINYYRKLMGLPPVTLDPTLSRACQLHAEYLLKNPEDMNGQAYLTESSKKPGYTPAGKEAAGRSIFIARDTAQECIDYFMSCYFQRLGILRTAGKIGVGVSEIKDGILLVLDMAHRDYSRTAKAYPVLYPVPDQKNVPLQFSEGVGDRPDPRRNPLVPAGFPITITPPPKGWHPENVSATLIEDTRTIPCFVYSKDAPAIKGLSMIPDVLILPKHPLKPATKYTVHVSFNKVGGKNGGSWEKRWSFSTASTKPVTRSDDYAAQWRLAVVERLNLHRMGAGLPKVMENAELSLGCQLHAQYIRENPETKGAASHTEVKGRRGYTEQGKKSASRSVVHRRRPTNDPAASVDSLLSTFYHRLNLLHPQTLSLGCGVARWKTTGLVVVIDAEARDGKRSDEPIFYPYPGQTEVPLHFALGGTEWPDPRPDKNAKAGYPITMIATHCRWKPGEATATLTANGKSVACWVFTKEKPALEDWPEPGVVCVLPKQPLEPSTTYTVSVRCKKYGLERTPAYEKTWSFTTAAKAARR